MSYKYGLSDNGQCTPLGGATIEAKYVSLIFFAGLKASGLCTPVEYGEEGSGNVDDVTYNPVTGELAWTGEDSGSYSVTGDENLELMNILYVQSSYTNSDFMMELKNDLSEVRGIVGSVYSQTDGIVHILQGVLRDYIRPMAGLLAVVSSRCKLALSLLMSYFRMLGLSRKQLAFWKENVKKDVFVAEQLDEMFQWSLDGAEGKSFLGAPVEILVEEDSSALVNPDKGKPRKRKRIRIEDVDESDAQHPEIIEVE